MPFQPGETPEGAKPFQPGQSGNPKGRPRKWVSTLKDAGYKKSEIVDCYLVLASMTKEEVEGVQNNEECTMLERTVAKAILGGFGKGSMFNLELIITRAYGQPKQEIDQTLDGKISFDIEIDGEKFEGEDKD